MVGNEREIVMNEKMISNKIARSIVGSEVILEKFFKYVVINYLISVRPNNLDTFRQEISVGESKINSEWLRVERWAKKIGIKARLRNMGITPVDGVMGVVVEFDRPVSVEEYYTL